MTDIDRSDEYREVWAEEDGAALLDELRATSARYVAFSSEHASAAVALWTAATHALPAFECAPRLVLTSPQKRCAKTRLLDIIAGTCHRPLATSNATVAAVFRSIGADHPPTLLIDEADTLFGSKRAAEQNEDLRALLNAGHQRGRPALRCVGPNQIPTEFPTFAMAALAGIGAMPDTIADRAINVTMRRRASGEKVAQFRSRRDGPILAALRERLAEWAAGRIEELSAAQPDMPVEDRAADTWEPLIAVADVAGGHWPRTARAACRALVDAADDADEERSLPTKLLADVRDIFAARMVSFLPSDALVVELRRIDDAPWNDFDLTRSKLAYRLREFGIKTAHNVTATARGYRLEDFADAFQRYIRQEPSTSVNPQFSGGVSLDGLENNPSRPVRQPVNPSRTVKCSEPSTCEPDGLTVLDGDTAGNEAPGCDSCGKALSRPDSIARGRCAECLLTANTPPGGITVATPGVTDRVQAIIARGNGRPA